MFTYKSCFWSSKSLLCLLFFPSLITLHANAAELAGSVQLRGSTTLLPIAQRVAEAYMKEHPKVDITISSGGTERGYKSILDGTADIGMASGVVPEIIADQLEQNNIQIRSTTVDYDAIVAVVHPSNTINNLTVKQLRNIFSGRITNWKDVGGINAPIKVYVGVPTGGITDTWKRLILGEMDTYTPAGIALPNEERMHKIMQEPLAVTYLTIGSLHSDKVKILNVDGVEVNKKTVVDGNYGLRVPLMLVTTTHPSPIAQDFIQYFLLSPKATAIDPLTNNTSKVSGDTHE